MHLVCFYSKTFVASSVNNVYSLVLECIWMYEKSHNLALVFMVLAVVSIL